MIPKITIFYGSWYRYIVAVFTSFSMYFLHTKHTIFTTMPIENHNFLIVKITGNSSNFGQKADFLINVCPPEKRTKRSSDILLCLVRFTVGQTLVTRIRTRNYTEVITKPICSL